MWSPHAKLVQTHLCPAFPFPLFQHGRPTPVPAAPILQVPRPETGYQANGSHVQSYSEGLNQQRAKERIQLIQAAEKPIYSVARLAPLPPFFAPQPSPLAIASQEVGGSHRAGELRRKDSHLEMYLANHSTASKTTRFRCKPSGALE